MYDQIHKQDDPGSNPKQRFVTQCRVVKKKKKGGEGKKHKKLDTLPLAISKKW